MACQKICRFKNWDTKKQNGTNCTALRFISKKHKHKIRAFRDISSHV